MQNHYLKTKIVKMGKWALLPLDSETWNSERTNRYFKQHFGIPKGILCIHTLENDFHYQYPCAPSWYFNLLYTQIEKITKTDKKALEKKLKVFYKLADRARREVSKQKVKNYQKLSNRSLVKLYSNIRGWIQRLAIFDQFAWLGEEYWNPLMENILANKLGLEKNSTEYNRVLFTLTKPEEISTTLKEKRDVALAALNIKNNKISLGQAAKILAKKFGWMPVFTYGNPWLSHYYIDELKIAIKKPTKKLQQEYLDLKNHQQIRNRELSDIVKRYKIQLDVLQVFIDFGLALDTRNEAEYFVGFGGFYLLPIYKEMARRLTISINQLRSFTEKELISAVLGQKNPETILAQKGKYVAWGYDEKMKKRIDFSTKEAERLYKYIDKKANYVQGHDEEKGICASSGKTKGRIRIIPSPSDNYKVKDGDILVTYATTTDYLPAMKRASAIITEVGGLTCHAAVVSREFNIPCIVALKNAMTNFKDGESVEVDADKGIIKRI